MAENTFSDSVASFTGRKPLYTSVSKEDINAETIPFILRGVETRHRQNASEIDALYYIYLGKQEILSRERQFATDVNNKIVVNRAQEIVRKVVGYFLGEPISYTSKAEQSAGGNKIEDLNVFMEQEGKQSKDLSIGNWASICGTAYRLVVTNPSKNDGDDKTPFRIPTCDPRCTGVIYSSNVMHDPVLGFVYSPILDEKGTTTGYEVEAYTDDLVYQYTTDGQNPLSGVFTVKREPHPHWIGEVPIIEYPNNQWRMGDFEAAIGLMNALNVSLSDRVNAVVQNVGSLLLFIDCEPDDDGTAKIKQRGSLCLKTNGNKQTEIRFLSPEFSQSDAQVLESTINEYIDAVTGVPSRKERTGGGGDTGDAVYLRDGFEDLEVVVRNKEAYYREGEVRTLRAVSNIMKRFGSPFNPADVQVNFVRNRTTNILNKSQAFVNLTGTNKIDLVDAFKLIGVTDQPTEMAVRGEAYSQKMLAQAQAMLQAQAKQNETGDKPVADKEKTTDKE